MVRITVVKPTKFMTIKVIKELRHDSQDIHYRSFADFLQKKTNKVAIKILAWSIPTNFDIKSEDKDSPHFIQAKDGFNWMGIIYLHEKNALWKFDELKIGRTYLVSFDHLGCETSDEFYNIITIKAPNYKFLGCCSQINHTIIESEVKIDQNIDNAVL